MKRQTLFFIVMILMLSISGIVSAADDDFYWSNINANPVKLGPPRAMTIYIDEEEAPIQLQHISTLHADGGAETGAVSIWMGDQQIGSWPWTGQNGYGASYTYRKSNVDVVLMPGYEYTIRDSDEASWCYNAQSENRGMVELIGRRLNNFNSGIANDACATPDQNTEIVLNDSKVVLRDDTGSPVPPLVLNNTVYIPARTVSDMTGFDFNWDPSARRVFFRPPQDVSIVMNDQTVNYTTINNNFVGPIVVDNTIYIPTPLVRDLTGLDFSWDPWSRRILVVPAEDILVIMDNETIDTRDADGDPSVPVIINNKVYLPVDTLSDIMGFDAVWDEEMHIMTITSRNGDGDPEDGSDSSAMGKKLSVAEKRYAIIKKDDSLWTWGQSYLGNGKDGSSWQEAVRIMDDVEAVYTGTDHSLALKKDGTLWSWGNNGYYKLGIGDVREALEPVKILDNVVNASIGNRMGAAVTADGGLYLWGSNGDGNLASQIEALGGTVVQYKVPTRVMEGVADVSCNDYYYGQYVMVLKQDGTLWTFGANMFGQLGDGRTDLSQQTWKFPDGHKYGRWPFAWEPQQIMDNVVSIFAGDRMGMAIKADGTLWTWGMDLNGRLGNGGAANTIAPLGNNTPTQTIPLQIADNVAQTAVTYKNFSGFLKKDGTVWAAGSRFGNVPVRLNIDDVVAISGDEFDIFALKSDGTLWKCSDGYYDCSQVTIITR